ncbi:hypothetical protein HELRODRAFT_167669 [Helobdella robusta]|uniref:CUB domain-containing protein n=1 Tax=Helobdella robusta TaxID=6412 RepID=T1EZN1_HELRO|nr:hypothetical protein HELRODRAFT_167669 [Helobdella robusta]ESO09850.1 hypothetical protein HELRODRAFT_167669 [Helobdella robusta]
MADRVDGSECDWIFNSRQTSSGDFHTPDYYIPTSTKCRYIFVSETSNEGIDMQVVIQLNVFYRQRSHENETCNESVSLTDGDLDVKNFCISEMVENVNQRYSYVYSAFNSVVTVTYSRRVKQISNPEPTWVNYKFRRKHSLQNISNNTLVLSKKKTSTGENHATSHQNSLEVDV